MGARVSIAMATFNGGAFIAEQLESFAVQDRRPDEIVINDDRSTDDTLAIISAFAVRSGIQVSIEVNDRRLGVRDNFAAALSRCTGDILFLSDQDDVWLPTKISRMLRPFEENPRTLSVLCDQIICNGDLSVRGPRKSANIRGLGYDVSKMATGCCTAHRRDVLRLVLPLSSSMAHDLWIARLLTPLGARVFVDEPLQLYRRHGNNESNWLASSVKPIGTFDRVKALQTQSGAERWERRARQSLEVAQRLSEQCQWLADHGFAKAGERAIAKLECEAASLQRRGQLAKVGRLRRLPMVFDLYRSGGYRNFHGMRSALGDMLR
ncbi:glycosyltransferase [Sphingomonas gilva]|uniref:Glycosyltransferase n=1 Tax=Sphingomonas gilva TaxID=2305907 RepID=A0A396RM16_9SPHN|nr:glycosyltransferase [Sphingomonas gilva]RHW16666.1 glycosyltransferase [Sphingomonas gilva]